MKGNLTTCCVSQAELVAANATQEELAKLRRAQASLEKEASTAREEALQSRQHIEELQGGLQSKNELHARDIQIMEQVGCDALTLGYQCVWHYTR